MVIGYVIFYIKINNSCLKMICINFIQFGLRDLSQFKLRGWVLNQGVKIFWKKVGGQIVFKALKSTYYAQ